jgi:hypothetical protein
MKCFKNMKSRCIFVTDKNEIQKHWAAHSQNAETQVLNWNYFNTPSRAKGM